MAATTGKSKKERKEEGEKVAEDVILAVVAINQLHSASRASGALVTHTTRS